ncbi:hypothetical protein ACIODX_37835 [Streptomyces sp. NPDC088190]|uniref:hypothetical protein n=1 Tax=unclassified Streptomyces TaxID=2593676 RepID=UPI002E77346B|nr:hypothetical protein [Streptomyces sp. JV190]MEE1838776.1 hypothetical protein [Streptomyces sp. JV190]
MAGRAGQSADDRDEELKRLRKLTAEQAKTIEILKKDGGVNRLMQQLPRAYQREFRTRGSAGGRVFSLRATVSSSDLAVSVGLRRLR